MSTPDVVVERVIKATPERIWKAWTDAKELENWFFSKTEEIDARKDGGYRILWEGNDPEHSHTRWGNYLEFDPPKKLVFEWMGVGPKKNPAEPGSDPQVDSRTVVSITLSPVENGTLVKIVHTGWCEGEVWRGSRDSHQGGWAFYLENLESVLAIGPDLRVGTKQKIKN